MATIAYVEIDLFGIAILFLFWLNQRRSGSFSLEDRLFNGILITGMLEQLMDAGQWLLDGARFPGSLVLQHLSYTLGYGIAPIITCLWAMYCDQYLNTDERALRKRAVYYAIPILLNGALLVANLFTPLVYTIDANHIYRRETWFAVYMLLMYSYGLLSLGLVMNKATRAINSNEKRELRYMALFIVPPLLGGVVQWLFYGVSIIWLSCVFSIALIYINVLSRQISTDELTGLNNRRRLNRYLDQRLSAADADASLFLMMLDADHFKGINDRFGHAAGDRALLAIADILRCVCARQDHFIARLGGDEFVLVGMERGDCTCAALTGDIQACVEAFNQCGQEPFQLSLSVGVAHFEPARKNTVDSMLDAADRAMYAIKSAKQAP